MPGARGQSHGPREQAHRRARWNFNYELRRWTSRAVASCLNGSATRRVTARVRAHPAPDDHLRCLPRSARQSANSDSVGLRRAQRAHCRNVNE